MPIVSETSEILEDGLRSSANTKGDKRMESTDSSVNQVSVLSRSCPRLRQLASVAYKIGMFIAYCKNLWDILTDILSAFPVF